jgi:hypothetical protein
MNQVKIFVGVIALLILGVIATVVFRGTGGRAVITGQYDAFAQCIKDSGATFYGAFWCPHCQAQKKMFGASAKLLPYVECSTLDGKSQVPACTEKGVSSYPTWEFADGSRLTGEVPLTQLAEKTGCVLPAGAINQEGVDTGASSGAAGTVPEEGDEVPGIAE